MEMAGHVFLKWRIANLLVGFPDIEICFGTRVRSLPNALRIATPKKRLPGAGGGFLTSTHTPTPTPTPTSTPGETNRHGQVIPAISPTSIIHGQNKKIENDMLEKRPQAILKTFSN
jgi:hypothetical protein